MEKCSEPLRFRLRQVLQYYEFKIYYLCWNRLLKMKCYPLNYSSKMTQSGNGKEKYTLFIMISL
jgi:hypothetical protein